MLAQEYMQQTPQQPRLHLIHPQQLQWSRAPLLQQTHQWQLLELKQPLQRPVPKREVGAWRP